MNEYGYARMKDIQEIKTLYSSNKNVVFSTTDNWIEIGGITYNGISRDFFEKLVGLQNEEIPKEKIELYNENFINTSHKEKLVEAVLKWKPSIIKSNLWKLPINDLREMLRKLQKGEEKK